jgi:hypothetical protein
MDTAIHEAAHGVAGFALGVKVYEIQVYLDGSGVTSYGMMRFHDPVSAERFAKLALAGPVAELRYKGIPVTKEALEHLDGASSDMARVGAISQQFDFPDVLPSVISMVDAGWKFITAVADRLDMEGVVTGDELKQMVMEG